jgi:hypothetical protein
MKMIRNIIGCLAASLLLAQAADTFQLIDKTGKKHGPYKFQQDTVIEINGERFLIDLPKKARRKKPVFSHNQLLETVKIKELEFRDTDIRDVVEFLRTMSRAQDPDGNGVNFVFKPGTVIAGPNNKVVGEQYPRITMSIRNVTLGDAIKFVDMATRKFSTKIEEDAVFFIPTP